MVIKKATITKLNLERNRDRDSHLNLVSEGSASVIVREQVKYTAKGGGYYRVLVDGAEVSKHLAEREALESAANHYRDGLEVKVIHDYEVSVVKTASGKIVNVKVKTKRLKLDQPMAIITYTVPGLGATGPDSTPDQFTFVDQTDVPLLTVITSNTITVTGTTVPTSISISGTNNPEYQIESDPWTNAAGSVAPGKNVKVRHTSHAFNGIPIDTVLTIGGVSDTFTSTTTPIPTGIVITASRTSGVSPCPIMFSLDGSTAAGYDVHDFWRLVGCYWDFDNPAATRGTFATGDPVGDNFETGKFYDAGSDTWLDSRDKNIVIGPPESAHTFIVPDGGGEVVFTVLVSIRLPDGQIGQASIDVTVQAQDFAFSDADTIAVSADLNILDDWSTLGFDRSPPPLATIGEQRNTMPGPEELDGKRVMVYNNDSASWGDYETRMGQSNFVVTYFGNDLTGTSVTASTITFEASPIPSDASNGDFSVPSWSAGGGLIKDSANGLGSFVVGRFITVANSAGQDGRYKIQEVSAGEIKVYRYDHHLITTENTGASITITEHHKKPQFRVVKVSVDPGNVYSATNGDIATHGWSENVTWDGLAINMMFWPMSYQHFAVHNIDGDNTLMPKGNDNSGGNGVENLSGVQLVQSAQYCWVNGPAVCDANSVPIPRGAYVSEWIGAGNPDADLVISERATISFVAPNKVFDSANGFGEVINTNNSNKVGHLLISGSTSNDTPLTAGIRILSVDSDGEMTLDTSSIITEPAGELITLTEPNRHAGGSSLCGAFNMPLVTWVAVYGNSIRKSSEHNMRINGGYRIFVYANDFAGEHGNDDDNIGPGGKHACALRSAGYKDIGDWGDGTKTRAIIPNNEDVFGAWNALYEYQPSTRYFIQHANWVFNGHVGNGTSRFQISTDNANLGLHQDCIATENYFADGGINSGGINQRMHGQWMTSRGHRYQVTPAAGRTQNVATSSKLCTEYNGAGVGADIVSCTPFYLDATLPILPSAPRP